jgi:hypothetical protein
VRGVSEDAAEFGDLAAQWRRDLGLMRGGVENLAEASPVIAATRAVTAAGAVAPPDTLTRTRPAVIAPGLAAVSNSYTRVPMVTISPSLTAPVNVSVPDALTPSVSAGVVSAV